MSECQGKTGTERGSTLVQTEREREKCDTSVSWLVIGPAAAGPTASLTPTLGVIRVRGHVTSSVLREPVILSAQIPDLGLQTV